MKRRRKARKFLRLPGLPGLLRRCYGVTVCVSHVSAFSPERLYTLQNYKVVSEIDPLMMKK